MYCSKRDENCSFKIITHNANRRRCEWSGRYISRLVGATIMMYLYGSSALVVPLTAYQFIVRRCLCLGSSNTNTTIRAFVYSQHRLGIIDAPWDVIRLSAIRRLLWPVRIRLAVYLCYPTKMRASVHSSVSPHTKYR